MTPLESRLSDSDERVRFVRERRGPRYSVWREERHPYFANVWENRDFVDLFDTPEQADAYMAERLGVTA